MKKFDVWYLYLAFINVFYFIKWGSLELLQVVNLQFDFILHFLIDWSIFLSVILRLRFKIWESVFGFYSTKFNLTK